VAQLEPNLVTWVVNILHDFCLIIVRDSELPMGGGGIFFFLTFINICIGNKLIFYTKEDQNLIPDEVNFFQGSFNQWVIDFSLPVIQ
jgi:hypothetical protein